MAKLAGKENDDEIMTNFIDETLTQINGNMDELLQRYMEDASTANRREDK